MMPELIAVLPPTQRPCSRGKGCVPRVVNVPKSRIDWYLRSFSSPTSGPSAFAAAAFPGADFSLPRSAPFADAPFTDAPHETYVLGNYLEDGVGSVWEGERYRAFRERLYSSEPPPSCRNCGTWWSL